MKKSYSYCLIVLLLIGLPLRLIASAEHLLPVPKSIQMVEGSSLMLNGKVRTNVALDARLRAALRIFLQCDVTTDSSAPLLKIEQGEIDGAYTYSLSGYADEMYSLTVGGDEIKIVAPNELGVIHAFQTLSQLSEGGKGISPIQIVDWPAFKLRGYMHDVGRSFISIDELKKQVRLLSHFKVNTFHWHLTENQAWRFEVKAYPQLTDSKYAQRFPGQYYTQKDCRELDQLAYECGMNIIPEIDMPGHSAAFRRAMNNLDMQSEEGIKVLKKIIDEVCECFPHAPYIHIGGDETRITNPRFLPTMIDYIHSKGKKVEVWNPCSGVNISALNVDLTQMWSTGGRKISGKANIDCRYNYTNHFDVFSDLVGIYKSQVYYADKGSEEIAGEISAAWNDRKLAGERDIINENSIYANIIAAAARAWKGGGKQYIEQGGTTLPNFGEEYEDFKDFETRFLYHKSHLLKDEAIPYVKQIDIRWYITDPFPNNGNAAAVFPPEKESENTTYEYNGKTYTSNMATGAGIYLRHTWGSIVPSYYKNPKINHTAYAYTYVYSPRAQRVGLNIEFQNYGRSEKDVAPEQGKWDRKGSRIWIEGKEILPPKWLNNSSPKGNEDLLRNENFCSRKPLPYDLQKGWNKVFIKLPYVSASGIRLNKWMFTFFITDLEGKERPKGILYSPTKSMNPEQETFAAQINATRNAIVKGGGTQPGQHSAALGAEYLKKLAEIEATLSLDYTVEQRNAQREQMNEMLNHFNESVNMPNVSTEKELFPYTFCTPLRENRYIKSTGVAHELNSQTSGDSKACHWLFRERQDGDYDIQSVDDKGFISPLAAHNTALKTQKESPKKGWTLKPAATDGYFIITSGDAQFNQTTQGNGYRIFNWGGGSNTSDAGCQYMIREAPELPDPMPNEDGDAIVERSFKISTGKFVASNSNKTYHSKWVSNDKNPQLLFSTAKNDMWHIEGKDAVDELHLYTRTFTLSTDENYVITGYRFKFKGYEGNNSNMHRRKAATVTTAQGKAYDCPADKDFVEVNVENLSTRSTSFTVSGVGQHTNIVPTDFVVTICAKSIDYKVAPSTGKLSGTSTSWFNTWVSTKQPSLKLSNSCNNMKAANEDSFFLSGNTNPFWILSAPKGYVIDSYTFEVSTKACSIIPEGGDEVSIADGESKVVSVCDINKESTSFKVLQPNKSSVPIVGKFNVHLVKSKGINQEEKALVFDNGGEVPYRIPGIAETRDGKLIAVADYRYCKRDIGFGLIDLRYAESADMGKTWSEPKTLLKGSNDESNWDYAFGDPSIVADRESDEVLVVSVAGKVSFHASSRNNPQQAIRLRSHDGGRTWDKPVNMTEDIYGLYDNSRYPAQSIFLTSGRILQSRYVKVGKYYRLYIAHPSRGQGAFVIYSDDFGDTWKVLGGPNVRPTSNGDESKVEELPDGSVLISTRVSGNRIFNRYVYTDANKAEGSWQNETRTDAMRGVNACNGALLVVPALRKSDKTPVRLILQSIPMSSSRVNVGIYYKAIETTKDFATPYALGADWKKGLQISNTTSCYSSMIRMSNDTIAFLYEENAANGGYDIVFKPFTIDSITKGEYIIQPEEARQHKVLLRLAQGKYFGTLCLPYNATCPKGMKVFSGKLEDDVLKLHRLAHVPAYTGVIVYGEEPEYQLVEGELEELSVEDNDLEGHVTPPNDELWRYFFSVYEDVPGFYGRRKATRLNHYSAFLPKASVKNGRVTIELNDETGIMDIEKAEDNIIYNLNGQRVQNPIKGSIYIINGKKVMR